MSRNAEDVMTILVATDIHLGFMENDPIRGEDTFNTLEEVLKIAEAEEVDFILLGGDLFHVAKPSPYCIQKCTELIRKYCLGDKAVEIEYLSDPHTTLTGAFNETVNYEDPNLNVSIPVFSIHGNHDDPTGQRHVSAMDLLASAGLVNYFGKCTNYDEVEMVPILLRKGQTKLALYGLSHIKDERLGRLFLNKKVKMAPPEDVDNWFHLLIWHQNRAARALKNFIPDDCLPGFLDLVVWGHEHDCRINPERKINDVFISQPGSTVATSLAAGEALPKHIGILKVHKKDFKITPVELKTVRPFIFDEITLETVEEVDSGKKSKTPADLALAEVKKKIEDMIQKAKDLGHHESVSRHPLIRLKVNCKNENQLFNTIRVGQIYAGRVANPDDMIKCQVSRDKTRRAGRQATEDIEMERGDRVEDMVSEYFEQNDVLKCLPVGAINETTRRFVDFNDSDAYPTAMTHMKKKCLAYLESKMPGVGEIDECIAQFKRETKAELQRSVVELLGLRAATISISQPATSATPATPAEAGSTAVAEAGRTGSPGAGRGASTRARRGASARAGRGASARAGRGTSAGAGRGASTAGAGSGSSTAVSDDEDLPRPTQMSQRIRGRGKGARNH